MTTLAWLASVCLLMVTLAAPPAAAVPYPGCEVEGLNVATCQIECLPGWAFYIHVDTPFGEGLVVGRVDCGPQSASAGHGDYLTVCAGFDSCSGRALSAESWAGSCTGVGQGFVRVRCELGFR